MKKLVTAILSIMVIGLFAVFILPANAEAKVWECYIDPTYERDWWGQYNIAAYVLEKECSGTAKLETVPAGTVLHIIAETDGWYKVETLNGNIGWTGATLITRVNKPAVTPVVTSTPTPEPISAPVSNFNLLEHVKGRLLLQVQQHGEIWYVSPVTGKRYQVTTANALPLFRSLSLGITNNDLGSFPKYGEYNHNSYMTLRNRVQGRLLLAVEDHGRVWYIHPDEKWRREVTQENIMDVFRKHSLGITDTDLGTIPLGDVNVSEVADNPVPAAVVTDPNVIVYDLPEEGISAPAGWQGFSGNGFSIHYPSSWYDGVKNIYPNWHYFSEELDYIQNLNTSNYMGVDTYVLAYKVSRTVSTSLSDAEALKQGGYYLDGYDIIDTDVMIIDNLPTLREVLYAPRGSVVYGGRTTGENETIILYTYRNGSTLYRVQFFNAHWQSDYGIENFDEIAKTFQLQ